MLKRPKNTDTMDDVLQMQRDYLEKKDKDFTPAAHVVSSKKNTKTSLFAKQRNIEKSTKSEPSKSTVIRDVVERKYDPKDLSEITSEPMDTDTGFPEVLNIDLKDDCDSKESLFASIMKKNKNTDSSSDQKPEKTECLEEMKKSVDTDNTEFLKSMSSEQIMKEREELLKSMDPNLIKFIQSKRKLVNTQDNKTSQSVKTTSIKFSETYKNYIEDLPTQDILEDANTYNYVNMDILEPEKLEWLKNVDKICIVPKDKKYEARFDLKGFLLPYILDEENSQKDNRELFCHEEESHRPGYTLQELFRLARAEMLQQRISAINVISGIINMYIQGFYDGIIDLPISKIFFFLRFGLDENIPVITESTAKCLSYIFYNEADEAILDLIFESNFGYLQPLIGSESLNEQKIVEDELDLSKMNLNEHSESLFESKVEDILSVDDREKESMTDFHLAEINLVECLERTNIIERISYIMIVMNANQNTNMSCIKILISLARHSEAFAVKIIGKQNLMDHLLQKLSIETPEESRMIIKLLRVMMSYNLNIVSKVVNPTLLEKFVSFVSLQNDMNIKYIQLQIESFRFLRLYFRITQDESTFSRIFMSLRYLLEWHFQHLDFHERNHFVCRIHASALLYLIQCSNVAITYSIFGETFKMCCKKWFQRASSRSLQDLSQKMILSCVLDVAGSFIKFIPEFFYDFITDYLVKFLASNCYQEITESLQSSSLLVNDLIDRRFTHKPLPNLGSIVRKKLVSNATPNLIYNQNYSHHFMHSLLMFILLFKDDRNDMNATIYEKLISSFYKIGIEKYLEKFSMLQKASTTSTNWFAQTEIKLIYNLLKLKHYNRHLTFKAAYNLILNLSADKILLVLDIFDNFMYHDDFADNQLTKSELDRMKYVYNGLVMSKIKEGKTNYIAVVEGWNKLLLRDTWAYEFLLIFLCNVGVISNDVKQTIETDLSEEEIISTTLKFKSFLNSKGIQTVSNDEQLMYLMLVYFGKELNFLNESIKEMIKSDLESMKGKIFKFNHKLNNEKDFESLYKLFLDTFQAQSYGDDIFSSMVMIPLSQKYDSKWRNIVWSEYAMVLKFINCKETDLLYDFNDYLYPLETDEMLLKTYKSSLKYLRKDSIAWKIAVHHLTNYSVK
ncbi:RNA polymerase II-associated protein 1 isoform X2 [Chironomus tepperi]|uniref:RNA polymerase II-associated protein 1 isoform X2 n=1 Tax=Chironomus tepperi TaxID=113505 RepID=UPI00391FA8E0